MPKRPLREFDFRTGKYSCGLCANCYNTTEGLRYHQRAQHPEEHEEFLRKRQRLVHAESEEEDCDMDEDDEKHAGEMDGAVPEPHLVRNGQEKDRAIACLFKRVLLCNKVPSRAGAAMAFLLSDMCTSLAPFCTSLHTLFSEHTVCNDIFRQMHCRKCYAPYSMSLCKQRQQARCTHVEFPNHASKKYRKPCNQVLVTGEVRQGKFVHRPKEVSAWWKLDKMFAELLVRPGMVEKLHEHHDYATRNGLYPGNDPNVDPPGEYVYVLLVFAFLTHLRHCSISGAWSGSNWSQAFVSKYFDFFFFVFCFFCFLNRIVPKPMW